MSHIVDRLLGKTPGPKRSSKWRSVRREFLKVNQICAACGGSKKLEVHHIVPFHEDPSLELEHSNLITLCRRKKYGIHCHLLLGHKGHYKFKNESIKDMAGAMYYYLTTGTNRLD